MPINDFPITEGTTVVIELYVQATGGGGAGGGDMYRSTYDANANNIVDRAELADAVAWANVTGKPPTFAPAAHDHDDRYYTEAETDALLAGKEASGTAAAAMAAHVAAADPHTGYMRESVYDPDLDGKVATAAAADTVPWTGVTGKPVAFPPDAHAHDDRYYTEAESDALLAGKSNTGHTHTSGEITDFNESVDDRVAALLAAGANIDLSYDDAGNLLTITATGGGGGATDHGALTGLADDDHPQYHTDGRGDARYTQRANNLSDVASVATSRTNLGLGTSAVLDVPAAGDAAAGQVVKGNDSRLTDQRTPADNSVTSAKIVDGAIVNADINAAAGIALSKLATDPLARANHTGTQVAATISDFNSKVNAASTALADGATITLDCDSSKAEQNGHVTLGGNRTFTWSNLVNGMRGNVIFTQDGTGNRTITVSAPAGFTVRRRGGSITLSTAAGAVDVMSFVVVNAVIYCTSGGFS